MCYKYQLMGFSAKVGADVWYFLESLEHQRKMFQKLHIELSTNFMLPLLLTSPSKKGKGIITV